MQQQELIRLDGIINPFREKTFALANKLNVSIEIHIDVEGARKPRDYIGHSTLVLKDRAPWKAEHLGVDDVLLDESAWQGSTDRTICEFFLRAGMNREDYIAYTLYSYRFADSWLTCQPIVEFENDTYIAGFCYIAKSDMVRLLGSELTAAYMQEEGWKVACTAEDGLNELHEWMQGCVYRMDLIDAEGHVVKQVGDIYDNDDLDSIGIGVLEYYDHHKC